MEKIAGLKAEKDELRVQKEYLNAMLRIRGGKKEAFEQFLAPPDPEQKQEIAEVEKRLVEVEAELAGVQEQLHSPEKALAYLKTVVSRASEELTLKPYTLRLDWKRTRLDQEDEAEGNEIRLGEFSIKNDDIHRSAVLVTFTFP